MTSALDGSGHQAGGPHGPVHQLGPEWTPGPDGMLSRLAARVLVLDARDRLLLLQGHDLDQPERRWWFTVGGGIDAGESPREAAARELAEETGLVVDPAALVGPVFTRDAVFDFFRQHCRQHEEFFVARLDGAPGDLTRDGWTAIEQASVDDVRWWSLDDLEREPTEVFPAGLAGLVRPLLGGWDGVTRHLG